MKRPVPHPKLAAMTLRRRSLDEDQKYTMGSAFSNEESVECPRVAMRHADMNC